MLKEDRSPYEHRTLAIQILHWLCNGELRLDLSEDKSSGLGNPLRAPAAYA